MPDLLDVIADALGMTRHEATDAVRAALDEIRNDDNEE